MAESAVSGSNGGRGFSRAVQKTVFRTKEKVLQNLGKADKTIDDELEQSLEHFNEQQIAALKLQKELKRYSLSLKEMNIASQNFYKTLKETFEQNWPGYTVVASAVENHCILWDDYLVKMMDVQNAVNSYSGNFPELRMKIAKRGRKLMDFDGARHTHDALLSTRKRDETKLAKALDELNDAKSVYESINDELRKDLPAFYNNRITVIASIFSQLCKTEIAFQEELAKVKNSIIGVSQKLINDGNQTNQLSQPRNAMNNSSETRNSLSADQSLKLSNVQYQTQSRASQMESNSTVPTKPSNIANSQGAQPSLAVNSFQKHQNESSNVANSSHLTFVEDSFVTAKSPSTVSMPKDSSDESSDSEEDQSENPSPVASSSVKQDQGVYSLARAFDDSVEYSVPRSNAPVNQPSIVPSERILFKVEATHAYVGEDIDELTFEPGEVIIVVPYDDPNEQDDGWLMGVKESTREKGVFPENFTKKL